MTARTKTPVDDVVEHVREMAEKYDFTPDEHTARDAISDSADALGLALTEAQVEDAYIELV
jgi:hypothetical protein